VSNIAKSVLVLGLVALVAACAPKPEPAPAPEQIPAETVYSKY
jgi:hypothetical protein